MPTVVLNGSTYSNKVSYMYQAFFGRIGTFRFPVSPVEVSFESISAAYEEIPRPQNYPILAWSELQLTKASVEFRLFDRDSGGSASIEPQLNILRSMASLPAPVWFNGVDRMLIDPVGGSVNVGDGVRRSFLLWRINDMRATTMRRNKDNIATQVDIQLSLIEERNPFLTNVILPRISYNGIPTRTFASSQSRDVSGVPFTTIAGYTGRT
jgi:hypothetical protein